MSNSLLAFNDFKTQIVAGKTARATQGQGFYDNTNLIRALALYNNIMEINDRERIISLVEIPALASTETEIENEATRIYEEAIGGITLTNFSQPSRIYKELKINLFVYTETIFFDNITLIENWNWVADFSVTKGSVLTYTVSLTTTTRGGDPVKRLRIYYSSDFSFNFYFYTSSNYINNIIFTGVNDFGAANEFLKQVGINYERINYEKISKFTSLATLESVITLLEGLKTTFANLENFLE